MKFALDKDTEKIVKGSLELSRTAEDSFILIQKTNDNRIYNFIILTTNEWEQLWKMLTEE